MPNDPQVERLATLLAELVEWFDDHADGVEDAPLWTKDCGLFAERLRPLLHLVAPAGEPAFPHCAVCGSSAWHCSVCPQPPSGCCAACFVRERTVTALGALVEIVDESTLDVYLRTELANLRAILVQPCAPSGCCAVREEAENLCAVADEFRKALTGSSRRNYDYLMRCLDHLDAALSQPCTHAAGSSEAQGKDGCVQDRPGTRDAGPAAAPTCLGYAECSRFSICRHGTGVAPSHCGWCGQPKAAHRKERVP